MPKTFNVIPPHVMKKSIVLSLLLILSFGVGWSCVFYPVTNYYIYKVVPADDAASGPSL